MNVKRVAIWVLALAFFVLAAAVAQRPPLRRRQQPLFPHPPDAKLADTPEAIYSTNPSDSWNRIFFYLFSRRLNAHFSSEFPEAAPFRQADGVLAQRNLRLSTRSFERIETGDRAIDPLYPSRFTDAGARLVLRGPAYTKFCDALQDALNESSPRNATARAMMQSDLWSAYDILQSYKSYEQDGETDLAEHRQQLLGMLGRLIRKLALNPNELASLPGNYAAARAALPLPDLFGKDGGWVEVQWVPYRSHDRAAHYRRVTRIFVKPTHAPTDMQNFLNDLRHFENQLATLDGVALVVQPLLIDSQGRLQPTNLIIDVQLRLFHKTSAGALQPTEVAVYEISRRRLLAEPGSGGLVVEAETDPAYLSSGGDYGFGSDSVIVRLRTRCVLCHGSGDLTNLMTFSMMVTPEDGAGPPVRRLDSAAYEAAEFVISQKNKTKDWMALRQAFETPLPQE